MRTLLNTMQDCGCLTWEAEVGAETLASTFLYTGLALQQQRAEDLLEQDRIYQLVQLVGDKATVVNAGFHLGRSFCQGRHILRVLMIPLRCVICYLAAHCAVPKPNCPANLQSGATRRMRKMGNWKQTSPTTGSRSTASLAFLFRVQESIFIMVVNWKWTT